jgi:hypothetical protein
MFAKHCTEARSPSQPTGIQRNSLGGVAVRPKKSSHFLGPFLFILTTRPLDRRIRGKWNGKTVLIPYLTVTASQSQPLKLVRSLTLLSY